MSPRRGPLKRVAFQEYRRVTDAIEKTNAWSRKSPPSRLPTGNDVSFKQPLPGCFCNSSQVYKFAQTGNDNPGSLLPCR